MPLFASHTFPITLQSFCHINGKLSQASDMMIYKVPNKGTKSALLFVLRAGLKTPRSFEPERRSKFPCMPTFQLENDHHLAVRASITAFSRLNAFVRKCAVSILKRVRVWHNAIISVSISNRRRGARPRRN